MTIFSAKLPIGNVLECLCWRLIGLSIVLYIYMRSLLLVENFDWHLGNQYILVRVILSCFRFLGKCVCARYVSCQGASKDT
jgi:hypothetical protein